MYKLLRITSGWITNDQGDFLVEDTEENCRMWVNNNLIGFNNQNCPYFRQADNENGVPTLIDVVDITNEFPQEEITSPETTVAGGSQPVEDSIKTKNTWSSTETLALITAIEARYDDMHHVHKRKNFWAIISEVLAAQNIEFSDIACKKKWLNLTRTYKNTKDIKAKTGTGPVKFTFYDRLDELLGDSPSNSSPHSLDVDSLPQQTITEDAARTSTSTCTSSSSSCRKRKNPNMELLKLKKQYLEKKIEKNEEKEKTRRLYVEESLKCKREKLELYKQKLELEAKKLKALEALAMACKNK